MFQRASLKLQLGLEQTVGHSWTTGRFFVCIADLGGSTCLCNTATGNRKTTRHLSHLDNLIVITKKCFYLYI